MPQIDNKIKESGVYRMKEILTIVIIILLIAFPFCVIVWAGLDAAGGSVINCPTVQSNTQTLTLDMVAPGWLTITGNILVEKNHPRIFLNNIGMEAPAYIEYRHQGLDRSRIGWDEGTETLQIYSDGAIRFIGSGGSSVSAEGNIHLGTLTSNFRVDAKAGGVIGTVNPNAALDDLEAGGTFTGTVSEDIDYKVEIDANGTPDTFKWSDDGGSTWDAEDVNITESAQTLNNGITVTFDANDGHTTGDYWTWTVTVHNPMWLQDAAGDGLMYVSNDGKVGIGTENPATILDVNGVATIGTLDAGAITGTSFTTTGTGTFKTITDSTLTITDGDISSSAGVISFDDENLITTGAIKGSSLITVGDIGVDTDTDLLQLAANALTVNGGLIVDTDTLFVDDVNDRVGIGTANPRSKLEVAGDIWVIDSGSNPRIVIGDSSGAGSYSVIGWNSAPDFMHLGTQTGGVNALVLTENGNVGIGTTAPNAPLEVKGAKPGNVGGFQSGMFHVTGAGTAEFSNSVITGHNAYDTNTQLWYLGSLSSSNNDIGFINRQNAAIHFKTNNAFKMIIDAAGDVGIGTTSPATILDVNGVITGAGLTVDSNSIRITTAKTPASSTDTGAEGEVCWDSDYVYVCVASNTWKRAQLTTWGIPAENVIYAGENVIYAGEDVVYP